MMTFFFKFMLPSHIIIGGAIIFNLSHTTTEKYNIEHRAFGGGRKNWPSMMFSTVESLL